MANHKSAKKRSRQNIKRNEINRQVFTKFKTSLIKLNDDIKKKNSAETVESYSQLNSTLAKALKKGLVKRQFVSRKLSSLSKKIKNI